MKLHYMGKYNGDEDSLPSQPHRPGAVAFREPQTSGKFAAVMALLSIAIFAVMYLLAGVRAGRTELWDSPMGRVGGICFLLTFLPHEVLHGICFREDAYIYTNLKEGMLFVFGPEDMTKSRFIFMSLLPNLIFGFIPYVIGMLFPNLVFFLVFGALSITAGAGDYLNVFNAAVQVPKGARIYLYGFHSYWYMP